MALVQGSYLIVDDDPDDVMMIRRMLNNAEAHYAHSVTDAFRQLECHRYDLVFLDVRLPDTDDVDHIKEIRGAFPEIPIVVLTSLDDERLAERCLDLGVKGFLPKGRLSQETLTQLSQKVVGPLPESPEEPHISEDIQRLLKKVEAENQQLAMMAKIDELTSLPNLRHFSDILHQNLRIAERREKSLGVLYFDLNGFKNINDTYGHAAGDAVLVQLASRLRSGLRKADFLARMSGDEFAVVTDLLDDPSQSYSVAKKIQQAVVKPFRVEGRELYVGLSLGIATYPEIQTADELLRCADIAMYEAKRSKTHFSCFYTRRLQSGMAQRRELENALADTIEKGSLRAEFQHIFSARGDLVGLEVFCRWHHPAYGIIKPAVFIPVAEAANIIDQVNEQMLGVVAQVESGVFARNLAFYSINLSPRQLDIEKFAEEMFNSVQALGLNPGRFCFEIDESQYQKRYDSVMVDLKRFGFQLALSNYGSGPTSIEQLTLLPLDYIKLGGALTKSVVHSENKKLLCETIVGLAHNLDIKVIAEMVENRSQKDLLQAIGCDHFQGNFIAVPFSVPH